MTISADLSKYLCEHYAYEVQMFRYTFKRLAEQGIEQADWNAMLESCSVHARVLRDFFASKSTPMTQDDRKATEYGCPAIPAPTSIEDDFRAINKQIAHLDKNRPFGASARKLTVARLTGVSVWIEKAHSDFISQCDADKKVGWSDQLAVAPSSARVIIVDASSPPSASSQITENVSPPSSVSGRPSTSTLASYVATGPIAVKPNTERGGPEGDS
jgi:hypothetical protein